MKKKESDKTIESEAGTKGKVILKTIIIFAISLVVVIPSVILAEQFRVAHPGKAWPWDNNAELHWYQITMWIGEIGLLLSGLKLYYINERKDV